MTVASNPERLAPSKTYEVYARSAVLAADVDLKIDGGGMCRSIYCEQAGDLVVTRPDGTSKTIPFVAGVTLPICAVALVASGSTVKGILVMW